MFRPTATIAKKMWSAFSQGYTSITVLCSLGKRSLHGRHDTLTAEPMRRDDADAAIGWSALNSVVLARTASGSTYVLAIGPDGVHWCRLPADPSERPGIAWSASGFEPAVPRIVPG